MATALTTGRWKTGVQQRFGCATNHCPLTSLGSALVTWEARGGESSSGVQSLPFQGWGLSEVVSRPGHPKQHGDPSPWGQGGHHPPGLTAR